MGKKEKTPAATKDEQQQPTEQTTPGPQPESETATKPRPRPADTTQVQASSSSNNTPSRPDSWYNGGSWRAKASPVAQIARESISVAKGATSEASVESAR
ncbi:hypothetical protein LTR17_007985 [Elasticomyces elasticus]|nr:hypothetical protein LTR17_007985 [Elasticomyces elasticus]